MEKLKLKKKLYAPCLQARKKDEKPDLSEPNYTMQEEKNETDLIEKNSMKLVGQK